MNQQVEIKRVLRVIRYAVLFGILVLLSSLLYLFFHPDETYFQMLKKFLLGYAAIWGGIVLLGLIRKRSILNLPALKRILFVLYGIAGIFLVLFSGVVFASFQIGTASDYENHSPFFRDKHIMVIVPHQDDEVNLTGGLLEQYIQGGSQVTLVFTTNGDYYGLAQARYEEAMEVAASVGIDAEDVYFLGYGDQWQPQDQKGATIHHIYNSIDADAVWTSAHGSTRTYGTAVKACYVDQDYTRNNFIHALTGLIESKKPNVIYCVDHDSHIDHKALDLFFEEAMGRILRENEDYHPVVYKGFCYGTAWFADGDFCDSLNLASTKQPDSGTWSRTGACYRWEERVRLPVSSRNISPMLSNTGVYQAMSMHRTQFAFYHATNVLNGDKVFWERRTDSLLYRASFFDGGEQVFLWNDFKLKDSFDISKDTAPSDGIRGAACIRVEAPDPITMDSIWLYDAPSLSDNILAGSIEFDNGTTIAIPALNRDGAPTKISFPELTTRGFHIHLTQTEGQAPGLAEIEAYSSDGYTQSLPVQLLMPVDADDNFVYDYWYLTEEEADFSLYTYPYSDSVTWDTLDIKLEGDPRCSYTLRSNGQLRIVCPQGQRATITVSYTDDVSTTFVVSNPSAITEWITDKLQIINYHFIFSRDFLNSYFASLLL